MTSFLLHLWQEKKKEKSLEQARVPAEQENI